MYHSGHVGPGAGPAVRTNAKKHDPTFEPDFQEWNLQITNSLPITYAQDSYPGNRYWLAQPLRRGPSDRQRFEAAGWYYDEIKMDAHSFLSVNQGRLSLRNIPLLPGESDKWESPRSERSQVQYWFDATERQEPADKFVPDMTVRVWHGVGDYTDVVVENYVAPASCDSALWDYQVLTCPPGFVTIAVLRPLRRGHLATGWWRSGEWNPTNKDYPHHFSHKPLGRPLWLPDDVGGDPTPPIDHDDL